MEKKNGEILIYQRADGQIALEAKLEDESLWLTQQQIAQVFETTQQNVSQHIRNIYDEQELMVEATYKKSLWVRVEGSRRVQRELDTYNLDVVIAVGYRINSKIATQFRIWATRLLREFIIKGFVMDDERLKNPSVGDSQVPDYFAEMLERVRDIRASERRMYLRVREIFTMAADYMPSLPETTRFFSIMQNKLHFTVTGLTAAELIAERVNHALPNMGLTGWARDEVRKTDVTIAKNYLNETEVAELNRIVTMWLDFAEDQAIRRKQVFMNDWVQKLDDFLKFNERKVLPDAGRVSKKQAEEFAHEAYELFAIQRRAEKEAAAEVDYLKQLEQTALSALKDKKRVIK